MFDRVVNGLNGNNNEPGCIGGFVERLPPAPGRYSLVSVSICSSVPIWNVSTTVTPPVWFS